MYSAHNAQGSLSPKLQTPKINERRRLVAAAAILSGIILIAGALIALAVLSSSDSAANGSRKGVATRLVIPFLEVDLPIVPGELDAAGDPVFPTCDVAHFLPTYSQPGSRGTTYLYAHAREGMLASLLQAVQADGGESLAGKRVLVYTGDARVHSYRIFEVKEHATDFRLADDIGKDEERLVIQTSEGPVGTEPKLQVAAHRDATEKVDLASAVPSAAPRACGPS